MKRLVAFFLKEHRAGVLRHSPKIATYAVFVFVLIFTLIFQPYVLRLYPAIPRVVMIVCYSLCCAFANIISIQIFQVNKKLKWTRFHEFAIVVSIIFMSWVFSYVFTIYYADDLLKFINPKYYVIIPEDLLPKSIFLFVAIGVVIFMILRLIDLSVLLEGRNNDDW